MDLDNLKKAWLETEIKPTIDECKIQRMLDNKGQSAYAKLIKYDKLFLRLLILCAFADIFLFYLHYIPGIIYFVLLVYSLYWQLYKLRIMKKTDLSEMTILEVSKRITKYKKLLLYEITISTIGIVIFSISYIYLGIPNMMNKLSGVNQELVQPDFAIALLIMIIATLAISYFLYKYMYFDNIKKVQDSIREIDEFEKENN
jgi:hypothetical protein